MTCEDSIGSAGVYGGLPIERFGRYLFMCEIPFGHIDQSLRRSWLPIENAGATSTPVPEHSSPLATTTATIKEPAQSMKQPIDVQRSSGVSMQQPIGPLDFVEADVRDDNDVVKRLRLRAYDLNKLQAILINKVLDELFIEIVEFPLWSEDQLLALASNCQELCVLQSSPPKRKMNLKEITNRLKRKLCISR